MSAQDDRTLRDLTRTITRSLNDFGYPRSFERDINAVLRGEFVETVIGMFTQGMIDNAPADVVEAARRAADALATT